MQCQIVKHTTPLQTHDHKETTDYSKSVHWTRRIHSNPSSTEYLLRRFFSLCECRYINTRSSRKCQIRGRSASNASNRSTLRISSSLTFISCPGAIRAARINIKLAMFPINGCKNKHSPITNLGWALPPRRYCPFSSSKAVGARRYASSTQAQHGSVVHRHDSTRSTSCSASLASKHAQANTLLLGYATIDVLCNLVTQKSTKCGV